VKSSRLNSGTCSNSNPSTRSGPDRELLRSIYDYDPDRGLFTFRRRMGADKSTAMWNGRCAGRLAGKADSRGYLQLRVGGPRAYLAHRLAWLYVYGEWPNFGLDHINGDPLDNRIVNLRPADASENAMNRKTRSDNLTGMKGVSYHRGTNAYVARIQRDGKRVSIGYFPTKEEAASAYAIAANKLHGEFARTA
jgi:hypothetical protein